MRINRNDIGKAEASASVALCAEVRRRGRPSDKGVASRQAERRPAAQCNFSAYGHVNIFGASVFTRVLGIAFSRNSAARRQIR